MQESPVNHYTLSVRPKLEDLFFLKNTSFKTLFQMVFCLLVCLLSCIAAVHGLRATTDT